MRTRKFHKKRGKNTWMMHSKTLQKSAQARVSYPPLIYTADNSECWFGKG